MIKHRFPFVVCLFLTTASVANEPAARDFASRVVDSAGGANKLLRRFRMQERYNAGPERTPAGTGRTSVLELPQHWWVGTQERGDEPAKLPTWAWTLGPLTDVKSKLALIPDVRENDIPLAGIRITGTITPALDMYFDKKTYRLARIDWGKDIYLFSNFKDFDGATYPANCTMLKRDTRAAWFHHEVLKIERLASLPANLKR